MEFKFDAEQEFQIRAIESVVRLFDGQAKLETSTRYTRDVGFLGSPNRLDITENDILTNLQEVQKSNGIPPSDKLEYIEQDIQTSEGKRKEKFLNFSIEMETGTGKTYVYIRTALELNRRYGFRRFVIVVPSNAIKEGVIKTFKITENHLKEIYENTPYRFYPYDSSNLTQVRHFCSSSNIEFMIMTLDSFNKSMIEEGKGNVIRRPTDRLQGAVPIHLIQKSRPILILDEPQNMESEKSVSALANLNPLMALRYSATHRVPYNLVYRLSPADAYRQGLVKKIEVASVVKEDDIDQVFIRLDSILTKKNRVTASVTINRMLKTGAVKEATVTVKPGDNLLEKTNLPEYESFVVEEINPSSNLIVFGNGVELRIGESRGADKEAIFESQIFYTIEEHLRKQNRLREYGIKVLSLFFVDRVENYASDKGIIRQQFIKAFNALKKKYPDWEALNVDEVQASYFAFSKKKSGEMVYEDSISGESQKDEEAYDLIMKDKEQLLSFDTKVSFIFSHSALREGWDNPNVFQICTLNQTTSNIKKRQEVGRGIRLAVDQSGQRVHDAQVNVLTVVANQSYDQYVRQLQEEIVSEYGEKVELPPKPANARKRTTIQLRKEYTLKPEFKELWDRIRAKTRYSVSIDSEQLMKDVVKDVDAIEIRAPRVVISKAQLDVNDESAFVALQLSVAKTFIDLAGRYPLPNLIDMMTYLLENTSPPVRLTRERFSRFSCERKTRKLQLTTHLNSLLQSSESSKENSLSI
jgi:type III restriction enzyme